MFTTPGTSQIITHMDDQQQQSPLSANLNESLGARITELQNALTLATFNEKLKTQLIEDEQRRHNQSRDILNKMNDYMKKQFEDDLIKQQNEITRLTQRCEDLSNQLEVQKSMAAGRLQMEEVPMATEEPKLSNQDENTRRMRQLEAENSQLNNIIAQLKEKIAQDQIEKSQTRAEQDAKLQQQTKLANDATKENERLQARVEQLQQQLGVLQTSVQQETVQVSVTSPSHLSQEQTDPHHMDRVVPDVTNTPSGQPVCQDTNPACNLSDDCMWRTMEDSNDDFYYQRQPPPQVTEASHPWGKVKEELLAHTPNMLRPVLRLARGNESPPQQVPDLNLSDFVHSP